MSLRWSLAGIALAVCWLCCGPGRAYAADYSDLAARAEASVRQAGPAGFKAVDAPRRANEFKPSPENLQAGLVAFFPDVNSPIFHRPPTVAEVEAQPRVFLAKAETACLTFAAFALKDLSDVGLSAGLVREDGGPVKGLSVGVRRVVFAPVANKRAKTYTLQGLWLADEKPAPVRAGQVAAWLIRVRAARSAPAGGAVLNLALRCSSGDAKCDLTRKVPVSVLPVRLVEPAERGYTFGAFCAGAAFNEAQFRQMKEHGIEAILWFWGHYGLNVINDNGKLRMDFSELDEAIGRFKRAGMRGPIVLALGNDCCGHFERAICQAFNLPMQPRVKRSGKVVKLAVLDDARIERLMVEALRQLFEHAKKQQWPEIVILPYDEPTERLMAEHRRMVGLFRRYFPFIRLYGVTMDRLAWAKQVLDTDILVANGDWDRILALAREHGKDVWFYGGVTASRGFGQCRLRYGLRPYCYHPDGMWFWSYNFYVSDPWNEFDGHTPDSSWVICWPPVKDGEPSVESLGYEGLRTGVNDVRYAMTLETLLEAADTQRAAKVRRLYAMWRKQHRRVMTVEQLDEARRQLTRWILQIIGEPVPAGL